MPIQDSIDAFVSLVQDLGWTIVRRTPSQELTFTDEFKSRHPNIPAEYLAFLAQVAECVPPSNAAWFLCESNYNGTSSYETPWDGWERLDIEWSDGDEQLITNIGTFWNAHLPIMLSARSDFSYLAISLGHNDFGAIHYGFAPYFREPTRVAGSFAELLDILSEAARSPKQLNADWPVDDFIT